MRLAGEVKITRFIGPFGNVGEVTWVSDGAVDLSIEVGADGSSGEVAITGSVVVPPSPNGDPAQDDGPPGFRPFRGSVLETGGVTESITIHHSASAPPAVIDAVQLIELLYLPGCY